MEERDFEALADRELNALLGALTRALDENADLDFEVDLSMGILTVEFSDGTKYVVNSHRAAKQIWMAAERNAWHFDPEPARNGIRWFAAKTKAELWPTLELHVSRKAGHPVVLANPTVENPDDGQVTSKQSTVRLRRN